MGKETKPKTKEEPKGEVTEEVEQEQAPDIMGLLNSPMAQNLLGGCQDLFKKEKPDTDTLEITIKGQSESVLELCKILREK